MMWDVIDDDNMNQNRDILPRRPLTIGGELDQEILNALLELFFSKPTPSLCDHCRHAYHLGGGSVSVGNQTYRQRYCNQPPDPEHPREGRCLTTHGYWECEFYQAGESTPPTEIL